MRYFLWEEAWFVFKEQIIVLGAAVFLWAIFFSQVVWGEILWMLSIALIFFCIGYILTVFVVDFLPLRRKLTMRWINRGIFWGWAFLIGNVYWLIYMGSLGEHHG